MAFIPVPNTAVFAIRGTLYGNEVVNTVAATNNAGWNLANLLDMNVQIQGWWATNMAPLVSTSIQMVDVYALSLASATAPSLTTNWEPEVNEGLAAGPALPGNVSFCVKFGTGARGRSGRGRNFIAGLTEAVVTENQVLPSWANDIQAAYVQLQDVFATQGAFFCVVQRYQNNAPLTTGIPRPILTVSYSSLRVATQRRRLT